MSGGVWWLSDTERRRLERVFGRLARPPSLNAQEKRELAAAAAQVLEALRPGRTLEGRQLQSQELE